MGPRSEKLVSNSVHNFTRVTHFWLCLFETQVKGFSSGFPSGSALRKSLPGFGKPCISLLFNRPGVAGAVLQTLFFLNNFLTASVSQWSFVKISSSNLHSQTIRVRKLKFGEKVHLPPPVTSHLSHVMCHVSCVNVMCTYLFIFYYKVLKLVGWGSVINMGTLSSILKGGCHSKYIEENWFGYFDSMKSTDRYILAVVALSDCQEVMAARKHLLVHCMWRK